MKKLFTAAEPTTPDEGQVREVVFRAVASGQRTMKTPTTLNPNRWSQWKPLIYLHTLSLHGI